MNSLFLYAVKVLICSGILFLYYWAALRNKKFHQYNRFYLLFSVVFSLIIPLFHLTWFTFKENKINSNSLVRVLYDGELEPIVVKSHTTNWNAIALYSIVGISVVLFLLLTIRVFNVFRLTRKYPMTKLDGVDFLDTDITNAPFSFLNYLFWKENIDIQSTTGQQILEHELTHIRQKHTWDKLFMQIISATMWFNPFYWLMQRELSMIHEFLADEKAIGDQDVKSFATMLLEAHFGKQILNPVNPFAYRPIKRRLQMLTTSSKANYSYARRLLFLPLLVIVTGLFAFRVKKHDWEVGNIDLKTWASQVGINLSKYDTLASNKSNAILPDSLIIIREKKGRDTIADIEPQKITSIKQLVTPLVNDSLSTSNGGSGSNLIIRGTNQSSDPTKQPLIFIDGIQQADNTSTKDIDPNTIESISVLKGVSAIQQYGDAAINGAIEITTKKSSRPILMLTNRDSSQKRIIIQSSKFEKKETKNDDLNSVVVVGFGKREKETKQNVDKEPAFVGGAQAWKTFLMRNLRADVPTENGAPANRNYTVVSSFQVSKKGKLSHIKIENDPGFGTAKEVIRLLKQSPDWEPATKDGKSVVYKQRQQVTFQVTEE